MYGPPPAKPSRQCPLRPTEPILHHRGNLFSRRRSRRGGVPPSVSPSRHTRAERLAGVKLGCDQIEKTIKQLRASTTRATTKQQPPPRPTTQTNKTVSTRPSARQPIRTETRRAAELAPRLTFLGGEWRTGTGSSAGARGTFLCLCLGGSIGSTCGITEGKARRGDGQTRAVNAYRVCFGEEKGRAVSAPDTRALRVFSQAARARRGAEGAKGVPTSTVEQDGVTRKQRCTVPAGSYPTLRPETTLEVEKSWTRKETTRIAAAEAPRPPLRTATHERRTSASPAPPPCGRPSAWRCC